MALAQRLAHHLRQPRGGLLGRWLTRRMARANARLNEWTLSLLDLQPGDRVLEIGYGPGRAIQRAANVVCPDKGPGHVAGIDFSEAMYRQAQARNARAIREGRVDLRLGDVTHSLPYKDASFDKLYAVQVLHILPDPLPVLREARRVLKPRLVPELQLGYERRLGHETQGMAAMTVRSGEALKRRLAQTGVYALYTNDDLVALFREAGFREARVERAQFESGAATCVLGVK